MYNCEKLRERYLNDNNFYALVLLMENLVLQEGFGMQEFREAAFFATWKIAVENQYHLIIPAQDTK